MKRYWAFFLVALLAACADQRQVEEAANHIESVEPDAAVTIAPNEAAVVIGYAIEGADELLFGLRAQTYGAWIAIDPKTGRRVGRKSIPMLLLCGGLSRNSACDGHITYRLVMLPPGTYTLGWASTGQITFVTAAFREAHIQFQSGLLWLYTLSEDAMAKLGEPAFTVGPGEVAYVGDLNLKFTSDKATPSHWTMTTSWTRSDEGARAFIARTGLADKMTLRPGGVVQKVQSAGPPKEE